MPAPTPNRTLALVVKNHQGGAASLALEEVSLPALRRGQALIRVTASPVNPNDLLALRNAYSPPKLVGAVAGFEGSGVVVAGSGLMARALQGRRVAFAAGEGGGAWAELVVADVMRCVPLRGGVSDEEGATMLTNPLTAMVLVSAAMREGHRAVVQAAAAGALGKMVARLALARGLSMLHVVRSAAQRHAVLETGAKDVLDSSAPDFEQTLSRRCQALDATLAIDPVGGALTGTLLRALPEGGIVRIIGNLSGGPATFDPNDVMFRRKRVEGFTMYEWVKRTSLLGQMVMINRVQGLLHGPLATEIRARVPLANYRIALEAYERSMSGGKILLTPSAMQAGWVNRPGFSGDLFT